MFKVVKDKEFRSNITLENTETLGSLFIGPCTTTILDILRGEGHDVSLDDAWNLPVSEKASQELSSLAMIMRKPIRAKVTTKPEKEVNTKESKKEAHKKINAYDVLLGLTDYV